MDAPCALLFIDAAWVVGDDFSLSRLIALARLRAKDVALICRTEAASKHAQSAVPAFTADHSRCPLLSEQQGNLQADKAACVVLPCVVLTEASYQRFRGEKGVRLLQQLLAGGQLYGAEVANAWTAEDWLQQATARNAAAADESRQLEAASEVPGRFKDAGRWSYQCRKQEHPVYTTSSALYGSEPPSQHDLPMRWSGIKSGLIDGVPAKRSSSLRTSIRRSKVHQALEGWN